jgi:hypothetical protein
MFVLDTSIWTAMMVIAHPGVTVLAGAPDQPASNQPEQ